MIGRLIKSMLMSVGATSVLGTIGIGVFIAMEAGPRAGFGRALGIASRSRASVAAASSGERSPTRPTTKSDSVVRVWSVPGPEPARLSLWPFPRPTLIAPARPGESMGAPGPAAGAAPDGALLGMMQKLLTSGASARDAKALLPTLDDAQEADLETLVRAMQEQR